MMTPRVLVAMVGAAAAFGASGAVLALMGAGVPFLAAAVGASACAGLVLYGLMSAISRAPGRDAAQARADEIEARTSSLRHDLRGALSPALILSDHLIASDDPAIRKAGEAVVRSIEQASALITASKAGTPAAHAPTKPAGPTAGPGLEP